MVTTMYNNLCYLREISLLVSSNDSQYSKQEILRLILSFFFSYRAYQLHNKIMFYRHCDHVVLARRCSDVSKFSTVSHLYLSSLLSLKLQIAKKN